MRFLKIFVFCFTCILLVSANHPVYVTVTEIEHNKKDNTLEISCKFFTDDLEKTLRQNYKTHVDLQDAKYKSAMNNLIASYVPAHLKLQANDVAINLHYVGYEIIEEGVYAYFDVRISASLKKLKIHQDLLFEFQQQQLGIVHVKDNGVTKSAKLQNPEADAVFTFPL